VKTLTQYLEINIHCYGLIRSSGIMLTSCFVLIAHGYHSLTPDYSLNPSVRLVKSLLFLMLRSNKIHFQFHFKISNLILSTKYFF